MEKFEKRLFEKFKNNKSMLIYCFLSVFIWGLAAHAFIFFNASFTHDSLNEFNAIAFGNELRLQYGRVFVPLYRAIFKTPFALPWLTGILALSWISLSLFLIVKAFNIKNKPMIFLLGGTMSVNLTVIGVTATFIHDLDCDMFSLLLSVLAFYVFCRYKSGFLWGSIFLCMSLGLYQSYISSAITLIIFMSLFSLMQGKRAKEVLKSGGKGILMLILGGILYLFFSIIIPFITKTAVATHGYNTIYKIRSFSSIFTGLSESYKAVLQNLIEVNSGYNIHFAGAINLILIVSAIVLYFIVISKKGQGAKEKILSSVLILVLPWGMNTSQILSGGAGHDLMRYAVWFIYLFVILSVTQFSKLKIKKEKNFKILLPIASFCMIFVLLWGNVQLSNTVYMKKDIECESTKMIFTRIVDKMEQTYGYECGKTPVAIIGQPKSVMQKIPDFDRAYDVVGCENPFAIGAGKHSYYQAYFDYVLTTPILLTGEETRQELRQSQQVRAMPTFPDNGCTQIIDGVLVVKLG